MGASKVYRYTELPTTPETVTIAAIACPAALFKSQERVVAELHAAVRHVNFPTIPVSVYDSAPKFKPEIVTELPIVGGTLDVPEKDTTGASNDSALSIVPIKLPIVT
jgi:hypothetical protein